jgi:hypothetical protein
LYFLLRRRRRRRRREEIEAARKGRFIQKAKSDE